MFKRVELEAVKLIESQLDDNHGEYYSYPDFLRKRGPVKASDNLGAICENFSFDSGHHCFCWPVSGVVAGT